MAYIFLQKHQRNQSDIPIAGSTPMQFQAALHVDLSTDDSITPPASSSAPRTTFEYTPDGRDLEK